MASSSAAAARDAAGKCLLNIRRTSSRRSPHHGGVNAAAALPDAEMDVMACLWRCKEATARQVRETIEPFRPMSHGAMVTLLKRLQAKGLVTRRKASEGKAFVYTPTRSPEPTYRRVLRDVADRIFGGNRVKMVATFLDGQDLSRSELDQLQLLLDELRGSSADKR